MPSSIDRFLQVQNDKYANLPEYQKIFGKKSQGSYLGKAIKIGVSCGKTICINGASLAGKIYKEVTTSSLQDFKNAFERFTVISIASSTVYWVRYGECPTLLFGGAVAAAIVAGECYSVI